MTGIKLLHVLAQGHHPQGVFQNTPNNTSHASSG